MLQVRSNAVLVLTQSEWVAASAAGVQINSGAIVVTIPDNATQAERLEILGRVADIRSQGPQHPAQPVVG